MDGLLVGWMVVTTRLLLANNPTHTFGSSDSPTKTKLTNQPDKPPNETNPRAMATTMQGLTDQFQALQKGAGPRVCLLRDAG